MLEELQKSAVSRKIRSKSVLFTAGSKMESVFFLLSGTARAVIHPENGKDVTLFQVGPGEFLGDDQATRDNYRYSAVVDETGEFFVICRERFLESYGPDISSLTHIYSRIGKLIDKVERLGIASAERRVLNFLQSIRSKGNVVQARGRVHGFASELDLAPETIYRSLKKLESQGAIFRRPNGDIQLCN